MITNKVFRISAIDGVAIVELLGVVSSLADDRINQELDAVRRELRDQGSQAVVVDLGQVAYFGSSMLEAIRVIWNDVTPRNGKLILCNASDVGREILQVAKFDHIWPLVESRQDAIQFLKD